jgi:hypothetical protein
MDNTIYDKAYGGTPEENSIWNKEVEIVDNVFTESEIIEIMTAALDTRKVTYKEVFSQRLHRIILPKEIQKKIIKTAENISGKNNLKIYGQSYAVYQNVRSETDPVKRPSLGEHYDTNMGGPRITFDIQMASNIDWPISVEGKTYSIKDNQAIMFSGTNQKHKREFKEFEDSQYLHMLFIHLGESEEDTEKCYYCNEKALYTDVADYKMVAVCKKHLSMGLSS